MSARSSRSPTLPAPTGTSTPPQRWSYLGGSGTLPTLDLLSLGGDHLLYVETNYFIPFQKFDLPVVGAPSVTLRHILGSAGVGKLPDFETLSDNPLMTALVDNTRSPVPDQVCFRLDFPAWLNTLSEPDKRVVDNAGFFHAGADPAKVSDEELYDRLTGEFPKWLVTARSQGILPPS